jgi:hypothetical protein
MHEGRKGAATVKERLKASLIPDGRPAVNDEIGSDCRQQAAGSRLQELGEGAPTSSGDEAGLFFTIYSVTRERLGGRPSTFHRLASPLANDGERVANAL